MNAELVNENNTPSTKKTTEDDIEKGIVSHKSKINGRVFICLTNAHLGEKAYVNCASVTAIIAWPENTEVVLGSKSISVKEKAEDVLTELCRNNYPV